MPDDHDEDKTLDLSALAVEEHFLEEWRAGRRPRLSAYVRRYPQHAAALAALVASLPPDADAAATQEPLADSFPERLWSGAGVERALASIFGDVPAEHKTPRVAEEPTRYQASHEETPRDE